MNAFAVRPRKPFVGLGLAAIVGIVLGDWLPVAVWLLASFAALAAIFAIAQARRSSVWVCTALAFATLHSARHVEAPGAEFARGLRAPKTMELAATVWSEPDPYATDHQQGATFWGRIDECREQPKLQDALCLVRWTGAAPAYGDRVQMRATITALEPPRNPGQFDASSWLRRQGIHFQAELNDAESAQVLSSGGGEWHRRFAIRGRLWIKQLLDYGLPPDPQISTLISSMVLGLRGNSDPDLKELFQETGTLHLFAVSGLNVAMLVVIAWYLLKALNIGRRTGTFLVLGLLAAYAVIVGMSASCVRATIVASFLLLAPLVQREPVPVNSLLAAAFIILLWDTNELFNPGFQLSFALVAVILGATRPLQRWCERPLLPDEFIPERMWSPWQKLQVAGVKVAAGTVAVGLACWVGSLFFMWGYFHLISPVALLANIIAVPLAFLILALGLMSLVSSFLFLFGISAVTMLTNHANWLCAKLLVGTVGLFADLPRGHLYSEWPTVSTPPACEIVALDVADGAAIHIRTGGKDWLVDAGRQRDFGRVLLPYLRSRGVAHLEGLLLTHGDTAHVGGAAALLDEFRIGWIGDTAPLDRSRTRRELHRLLADRQIGRRFYQRGDVLSLAHGADAHILYPPPDWPRAAADDRALVLRIQCAGTRVLLVSDISFAVEQWLLKHEPDLRADVMIKGWPSQDFSGTQDFVSAITPKAVVCSAPKFGDRTEDMERWAEPFRTRGIRVITQKESGAVRIQVSDAGTFTLQTWR